MSKGGGTRQNYFPNKASAEDILNVMKLKFFPDGSSSLGKLCDMRIRFGSFQQQVLDVERFTLSDYISKNKFTKTRLYLLSKEKPRSQKIRDSCTESLLQDDDDDDDDDFELNFVSSLSSNNATSAESKKLNTEVQNANRFSDVNIGIQVAQCSSPNINLNSRFSDTSDDSLDSPSNLGSTSNYITRTQAPVNLITPSTERQTALKLSDTITSSLIGTTTERQRIQREIQNSYDESLIADQEKDEKQDRIERSLSLQQIRENRVPQEPDIQEDHIVMSLRHPVLATRR